MCGDRGHSTSDGGYGTMGLEVVMSIVPEVLVGKQACSAAHAKTNCSCEGCCTGYATQENCPPLIVLAVLAVLEETTPRAA